MSDPWNLHVSESPEIADAAELPARRLSFELDARTIRKVVKAQQERAKVIAAAARAGEFVIAECDWLIPPGVEAQCTARAQDHDFETELAHIVVRADLAPYFSIVDFAIGNWSQLENADHIPATQAVLVKLGHDLMNCEDVMIKIINTSSEPRPFYATLRGLVAHPAGDLRARSTRRRPGVLTRYKLGGNA